jgi:putative ABC transport system permease protein
MLTLAAKMLRFRKGSVIATLIGLTVGVAILMACGVMVESGLRHDGAPERYAAADLIVAKRDIQYTGKEFDGTVASYTVPLPEGGRLPASLVAEIGVAPGVETAVADHSIPLVVAAAPEVETVGRGWASAALTPYSMVAGEEPRADGDVVVDERLATASGGASLRPGTRIQLVAGGVAREYRISGVAASPDGARPAAVFFTDTLAARLSPHPDQVDAIGVLAEPGADRAAMVAAVGRLAAGAGGKVYAGRDRGLAERPEIAEVREFAILVGGSFGGYVAMLVVFVVAGTVGLSVRHRRRDLALLRAVAATPGQVRKMVLVEAVLVSASAAVIGVPAGYLAIRWVRDELVDRGFVPAAFTLHGGVLPALAAVLGIALVAAGAAWIAALRNTGIRPTEALGEIAVEPRRPGKVRLVAGLISLGAGFSLTTVTSASGGLAAIGAATGMLYTFVLAVALLAPWINRGAARLLSPVLHKVLGTSGYLAGANLRANAYGMVPVLTALVLAVGFGGSVWFLQDNLERQTVTQSRDGMVAAHALISAAGLPASAVGDVRDIPGVRAATAVQRTTVIVKGFDGGEQLVAQAVAGDRTDLTMDLGVREGGLADLRGDTVAVSRLTAESQSWEVGEQVSLWLGDGTRKALRVVAVYERRLGFGDVTLPREVVAGHTRTGLADRVLIAAEPDTDVTSALTALASGYPGTGVVSAADLTGELENTLALSAWLNKLLIGVMVGYAALAAGNTMIMAALARGRELSLLRLVGVTRGQVKRMVQAEQIGLLGVSLLIGGAIAAVTLSSIVAAVTGQRIPYVPALGLVAVISGTTVLALVTTILPVGRLLRIAPVEGIGSRE